MDQQILQPRDNAWITH